MDNMDAQTEKSPKEPWYKIWFKVYFSPTSGSYQKIISAESASSSRATIWVVISTAINVAIPVLLYWISNRQIVHDDLADVLRISNDIGWTMYVVSGFLGVALSTLFFVLAINIINWIAQKLGGSKNKEQLGFLVGAIWAPSNIIDSVIEGLTPPLVGLVFRFILMLFEAFLLVISLRAANRLTWWRAIASVAILGLFILILFGAFTGCMTLVSYNR
jgi:hypothetical protein